MRRTIDVTISEKNRDEGKVFRITEKSAAEAEDWAMRALVLLTKAGVDIPANSGMAGIAAGALNHLGQLPFDDAKMLLDQMFTCIERVPDPSKPMMVRALVDTDTEEVMTRIRLRGEVLALHTGFSLADVLSKGSKSQTTSAPSQPGRTSRRKSRR